MEKNEIIAFVLVFGTILMYVVIVGCVVWSYAPKEKRPHLDERQVAAQGRAYRCAFWVVLVYYLLYFFLDLLGLMGWCEPRVLLLFGVIVGFTVWLTICIISDAYAAGSSNTKNASGWTCAVFTWSSALLGFSDQPFIQDGVLTLQALRIGFALSYLVLSAAFFIRYRMDKKSEREEQE